MSKEKDNPVPGGNDRKFEKWGLTCPTDQGYANKTKTVEVFTHPANGHRGAKTVSFRASYDGIGFEDTDVIRLRERLEEFHMGIADEDYEKVLVVETTGGKPFQNRYKGHEFGLQWQIGWRVTKLGFIFDENRKHKLSCAGISDSDIKSNEFHGGKKMSIIAWTEAREAALLNAAASLEATRLKVDAAMRDEEAFTLMLDTQGMRMLEAPKEGDE